MSFMYEGHPSADQTITAYSPTAFSAAGQTCYLPVPFRAHVMECGFIPITSSVTSAITMQVRLSSVAGGSFTDVLVASGSGTFASGALVKGAVASVSLDGTSIVPKGSQLEFTHSGGFNSAQGGCTCYVVVRRAASQ